MYRSWLFTYAACRLHGAWGGCYGAGIEKLVGIEALEVKHLWIRQRCRGDVELGSRIITAGEVLQEKRAGMLSSTRGLANMLFWSSQCCAMWKCVVLLLLWLVWSRQKMVMSRKTSKRDVEERRRLSAVCWWQPVETCVLPTTPHKEFLLCLRSCFHLIIAFRREEVNSALIISCSVCRKAESLSLACSGRQSFPLCWRKILATKTSALKGASQLGDRRWLKTVFLCWYAWLWWGGGLCHKGCYYGWHQCKSRMLHRRILWASEDDSASEERRAFVYADLLSASSIPLMPTWAPFCVEILFVNSFAFCWFQFTTDFSCSLNAAFLELWKI